MSLRPPTLFISNIAWDFVWQRHQSLASLFARDGAVVFCEIPGMKRVRLRDFGRVWTRLRTLREPVARTAVPAGIELLRPFVLPSTNAAFRAFNARQIRKLLERRRDLRDGVDVIVNYSPTRTAVDFIRGVAHRRAVYDCTDDFLAVPGIPQHLKADERDVQQAVDITIVPSRRLEEVKRAKARSIVRVPHGAFVERFLVPARPAPDPRAVSLLYYGHLHAQHLDFVALTALANARPGWRIVLVGPVKTPHRFPPNVELAGQVPHEQLRAHVAQADVLLLPYQLNAYTRAVMPAKTYECLATGRPVVATPLPELVSDFSAYFHFAREPAEWTAAVERALGGHSAERAAAQIACARQNTWEDRYRRIRALLASV